MLHLYSIVDTVKSNASPAAIVVAGEDGRIEVELNSVFQYCRISNECNSVYISNTADPICSGKTIFVGDLGSPNLLLSSPIAIYLEQAGEEILAYSYDLEEIAVGESETSAIEEMKASISDAYFLLKGEQENLGPIQQRHWDYLRKIVREV